MSQFYGLWEVLGEGPRVGKRKEKTLLCRCTCGVERAVNLRNLKKGTSVSCGCDKAEKTGNRARTHGMSNTLVYRTWHGMWERCTSQKHKSFAYYGGRGVTVCERWKSFANFYADMGDRPKGTSLERRDNAAGYAPDNCYWATKAEQMNNTRANAYLTHKGETLHQRDWAKKLGITQRAIAARITYGWSIDRICTTTHQRLTKEK